MPYGIPRRPHPTMVNAMLTQQFYTPVWSIQSSCIQNRQFYKKSLQQNTQFAKILCDITITMSFKRGT